MDTEFVARKPQKETLLHKIFPITKETKSKVIALCLFKALVSFLYTILKVQKENNIVVGYGAESIAVPKVLVFICSLGLVFLYTWLNNRYKQSQLFYGILVSFLAIFLLYTFVLLPNWDALKPTNVQKLRQWSNNGFWHLIVDLYVGWIDVFFFIAAELWGQFCIFIFFWNLSSELCNRSEAKRIYHLFIAAGCLGGIFGTKFLQWVYYHIWNTAGVDIYADSPRNKALVHSVSKVIGITGITIVLLLLVLYNWINTNLYKSKELIQLRNTKTKLSFSQGVRYIISNPYLLATTMMVVGCAVTISLTDITFRKYVETSGQHGTRLPVEYADFKASETININILSTFACLLIAPYVMHKFDWKVMAYLTPVIVLVGGTSFFGLSILNNWYALDDFALQRFGLTAKGLICRIGLYQTILAVVAKYAFFDGTKEFVFVGMGQEARKKGKPAVDVVGSRLGKFLSGGIHASLMLLFSQGQERCNVQDITHILLLIFLTLIIGWLASVRYLTNHLKAPSKPKPRSISPNHAPNISR